MLVTSAVGRLARRSVFAVVFALIPAVPAFASVRPDSNTVRARDDVSAPILPATMSLGAAISYVQAQISGRAARLASLTAAITQSKTLSSSDRSELLAITANATAGMNMLTTKVSAETSLGAVRADAATMVLGYHVYALVAAQVKDVIVAEGSLSAVSTLTSREPELQAAIAALDTRRRTHASYVLHLLGANLTAAQAAAASVAPSLLSLSAANFPAAEAALATASASKDTASHDVSAANNELSTIIALLAGTS